MIKLKGESSRKKTKSKPTGSEEDVATSPAKGRRVFHHRSRRRRSANYSNRTSASPQSLAQVSASDCGECSSYRRNSSVRWTQNEPGFLSRRQQSKGRHSEPKNGQNDKASASTSTPISKNSDPEIPGFYYDKEQRRYFKILPKHNNLNVVTKESIAKKEAEAKRTQDVINLMENKAKICSSYRIKTDSEINVARMISKASTGELASSQLDSLVRNAKVSHLKPHKSLKVFADPFGSYEQLGHMLQLETSPQHNDVIGLWKIKGLMVQRLQLLHIHESQQRIDHEPLSLNISLSGTIVLQSWNNITNVCWAPLSGSDSKRYILYTTMCHMGYSNSLALIRNLNPSSQEDFRFVDFQLGKKVTWTCAWNRHLQQFSVGSEKGALLLDVETKRMWELSTNSSDALAQVFGTKCLFSGTRRGEIFAHDLCSITRHPAFTVAHRSSICSLRLLNNNIHLISCDFRGKLKLWDLRMKKVVLNYHGHNNEYTRLSVHVDETESILYGAGQDCYCRFWNIKTGELLHTLPPPYPASRDLIPAIQYSDRWGGRPGNAGVIMGIKDELHFYV